MSSKPTNRRKEVALSFLFATCLLFLLASVGTVGLLKKGVRLEKFSYGRVSVSDVFIVWRDKLELQISELSLDQRKKETVSSKRNLPVGTISKAVASYSTLFSKISIATCQFGEQSGTFLANQIEPHTYSLSFLGNDLQVMANLIFSDDNRVTVDILEANSAVFATSIKGQLRSSSVKKEISGNISANIAKSFPVDFEFTADNKGITFQGQEAGPILEIKPLVDLFGLSPNIQRWITDYLKGTRYHLNEFKGAFPWHSPALILETLFAKVQVDNCEYTFAPGIDAITSNYTNVVFSKGVLNIIPAESDFYGQSGENSWLNIDFNDTRNIILSAYIQTHAVANKDIQNLLNHYNISFPLLQLEGETAIDLTLTINLSKNDVKAEGHFLIDDGVVSWGNRQYTIANAKIGLEDSELNIEELEVGMKGLFLADVSGPFSPKSKRGNLTISLKRLETTLGDTAVKLHQGETVPLLHYTMTPEGDTVEVDNTSWRVADTEISLSHFKAPLNFENFELTLPEVEIETTPGGIATVSGNFSAKNSTFTFDCLLQKFSIEKLHLDSNSLNFSIDYDTKDKLTLRTTSTGMWNFDGLALTLEPSTFQFNNRLLSITHGKFSIAQLMESSIQGEYNLSSGKGTLSLTNLLHTKGSPYDQKITPKNLTVTVKKSEEILSLTLPDLQVKFDKPTSKGWTLQIGDLKALQKQLPALDKIPLENGQLSISSENGKRPYTFSGNGRFDLPILVSDTTPITDISLTGKIASNGLFATVNDSLQIAYTGEKMTVQANGTGINLPVLITLITPKAPKEPTDKKRTPSSTFGATIYDTYLFLGKDSKILADQLDLTYHDNTTTAKLKHGQGTISSTIDGNIFSIEAVDLNDIFMGSLIHNSIFSKGKMSVAAHGAFNDFSTILKIENTTLKSMKSLNNIMALLNTVPALVTFSVPEYSRKGLDIDSAIVGMTIVDRKATVKSMQVESPQLSMTGLGWLDFPQRTLELDLSLTTKARSNIKKIPIVGYIVTSNKEDESTSLQVSGKIGDPEVKTSLVKDVATMPFDILYSILNIPIKLVKRVIAFDDDNEQSTDD